MKSTKSNKATEITEQTADQQTPEIDYKTLFENATKTVTEIKQERDEWKLIAETYSEKFAQAYKGFLILKGSTESFAEAERQKLLNSIKVRQQTI